MNVNDERDDWEYTKAGTFVFPNFIHLNILQILILKFYVTYYTLHVILLVFFIKLNQTLKRIFILKMQGF